MSEGRLIQLSDLDAVERLLESSAARPQLVFKHSALCPLSSLALSELRSHLESSPEGVDYWMVTVQTHRPVSDSVEERLAVRHETPQAILVRDGRAVWNASHRRITEASLAEALAAR